MLDSSTPLPERDRNALLATLDRALLEVDELHPLDESRFLRTHVLYEGRSDQQQRIIDWFGARIPARIPAGRPYRVLGVGCGSGILDVPVARHLAATGTALHYVGVDPNQVECEAFTRRFAEAGLPEAHVEVVATPFEAYEPDAPFDLVHLVHCLYYLQDPAAALARARELVAPGGVLVVAHAPCEALNDLAVRFYDKAYGRATLFADDCARVLDTWDGAYQRERIDAAVDVTPMLAGDPDVGLALRDFIVQFDSTRLPQGVQDLVDRYLAGIATVASNRGTIAHPVDIFVIDG